MKILSQEEVSGLWKKPKNKVSIDLAQYDNRRQLFHAKLSTSEEDTNEYLDTFYKKAAGMLNNKAKFNIFKKLLTFPLKSNAIISKAADEFNKINYAQDRVEEYSFEDESLIDDFKLFRERTDFESMIEQNLFTKAKQSVNTVAIVDTPALSESSGGLTEPYIYFLEVGDLHDVATDDSGAILYVMFVRGTAAENNEQLVVIDGGYYRVYDINRDKNELSLVIESAHELDYCPCSFIWRDPIDTDVRIRRFNSILEMVGDMDDYVILHTFSQHASLYSSFPIMWKYVSDNSDEVDETGQGGVPSEDDYSGPGTLVEMSLPAGGEGSVTMGPPAGFIIPDIQGNKFVIDRLKELEVKITKHFTGVDNEIQNEKAFNESQVRSQYETRHSVLRYWAENIQFIHKFLIDTVARLRYREQFIGSTIDYGMDYFLYDSMTATKEYEDSREAGLPMYVLKQKRLVVEQTITRSSPNARASFDILAQLEPYVDMHISLLDKTTNEYELKANFSSYIARFERENGDMVKYLSEVDFDIKINDIKKKINGFVEENVKKNNQE